MVETTAFYCLIVMFVCVGLNLIRIALGPSLPDRAIAADCIFINLAGICALYSVFLKSSFYVDLVLVFSLLGFVGTICFAKFISHGTIIE